MSTPVERVLTRTLHGARQAAPEPSPGLVEAVHEGLRGRRRRVAAARATVAGIVVLAVAVTILRPAAPARRPVATAPTPATTTPAPVFTTIVTGSCTLRDLPLPSSFPGQPQLMGASDIDPTGRYVAGTAAVGTVSWALLWVNGKPRVVDKSKGTSATAVNTGGVVVGWHSGGGWVYRDGRLSPLLRLPHTRAGSADAVAINTRGDIVGISGGHPVIWPGDQPGQTRTLDDGPGQVDGISDTGLMVGRLFEAYGGEPRLWNRDGTVHPQPPGFQALMVAGTWVLGQVDPGTTGAGLVLWSLTTGAITPLTVDPTVTLGFPPFALSESGAVLINVTIDHNDQPAILRNGKIILLPLPKDHPDYVEAHDISADGRTIVGTAGTKAVIWHC